MQNMEKTAGSLSPFIKASDFKLLFPLSLDTHINTYDTQIYSVLIHKDNSTYLQHVYSTDINVISNFLFHIMLQAHIWDTTVLGSTLYRWACQLLKHLKINITSISQLQTHRTFIGLVKCFDLVCMCMCGQNHMCMVGYTCMHACICVLEYTFLSLGRNCTLVQVLVFFSLILS